MNLSISNIAWREENNDVIYTKMRSLGYTALEIAPTRFIETREPYEPTMVEQALEKAKRLHGEYGLSICSMQSILYGVSLRVFGDDYERQMLLAYLDKACSYAYAIKCKNLVFGCPKNRIVANTDEYQRGVMFFKDAAKIAEHYGVVLSIEANPEIYGTNYITRTSDAFKLVHEVESHSFGMNLDLGAIIANDEPLEEIVDDIRLINHVHISEPCLAPLTKRERHCKLAEMLKNNRYPNYSSIEMGFCENIEIVMDILTYISATFK